MPLPFIDKELLLRQPDGKTIAVIGSGNQHFARFRTIAGDPIVENRAARSYTVRRPGELLLREGPVVAGLPVEETRWRIRGPQRLRTLKTNGVRRTMNMLGATDECVGLCILVDFADCPATMHPDDVDAFWNQPGYSTHGNLGSVRDYFDDASAHQLQLRTVVTPWYRAKHNRSYYESSTEPYPESARELVAEALDDLVENWYDFTELTLDSQQCIRAISVVYAGPETAVYAQGLWGHASKLTSPMPLGPGIFASDYVMVAAKDELTLGVFCHEMGHMLCDFPDLYPYIGPGCGVGDYCLMAHGGTSSPTSPVELSAYLKLRAGWATAAPLTSGPQTALAGTAQFFIHSRTSSEYLLIENRCKTLRDVSLPTEGLAVWRVDESGDNTRAKSPPVDREECTLVEADGGSQLQTGANKGEDGDLFGLGFATALSGASHPNANWQDGSPSNLDLANISATGTTMTFTVS